MPSKKLYKKVIDIISEGPIKPTPLAARIFAEQVDWSKSREDIILKVHSDFITFRNEIGQVIADLMLKRYIRRAENSDLHVEDAEDTK